MQTVKMVQRNGDGGPGRPTTRVIVNGYELTLTAWKAFEALVANPEMDVATLGRRLRITKSRVYSALRELSEAGLVEKKTVYRPLKAAA